VYLTKLAEAGVLGVGDGVTESGEIDVSVIPHLPILMMQPLIPGPLLRLLEELLVLRRHGQSPPPPRAGTTERRDATNSRVVQLPPRRTDVAA
jgi:hypothetical protein